MVNPLGLPGEKSPSSFPLLSDNIRPRDFDIGDSIQCLRYYAGWADKITGQVLYLFMSSYVPNSRV